MTSSRLLVFYTGSFVVLQPAKLGAAAVRLCANGAPKRTVGNVPPASDQSGHVHTPT